MTAAWSRKLCCNKTQGFAVESTASVRKLSEVIPPLLALLILITYLPSVFFEFVNYDDPLYAFANPHVASGITISNVVWAFTTLHGDTSYWHPLTWISHQLDWQLFGSVSGRHHLVNVFLHAINSILLFFGLTKATNAVLPAALGAALFGLHPMHVESVAWISERKDLLSTFFFFLTIGAYFAYVELPSKKRYALMVLLFSCALCSKPSVVILPFVLVLLDVWPLRRFSVAITHSELRSLIQCLREKVLLFGLSIGISILTFVAQSKVGAVQSLEALPMANRLSNSFVAYLTYLEKFFWPSDLCVLYYHPGVWPDLTVAIAACIVGGLSLMVLWFARQCPLVFVGWFWFLGALVPLIGIVQVGSQAYADRYTYISYIGVIVLVVWVATILGRCGPLKVIVPVFMISWLVALALQSMSQLQHWQSSETLFRRALDVDPQNAIAHTNYGAERGRLGYDEEAAEHYRAALRINSSLGPPNLSLGFILLKKKDSSGAAKHFARALEDKSGVVTQQANLGLAYVLALSGEGSRAIHHYEQSMLTGPTSLVANQNLASLLATYPRPECRDGKRAVILAEGVCRTTHFSSVSALNTLAAAYAEAERFADAVRTTENADKIARSNARKACLGEIKERLEAYRHNKPFHVLEGPIFIDTLTSLSPLKPEL